jgi:hypothetical protein
MMPRLELKKNQVNLHVSFKKIDKKKLLHKL